MFSFRGKAFFLTYPKCDLALEFLLESLRTKFLLHGRTITKYVLANEKHADESLHRHAFIGLDSEFRHKERADFLDVSGFHPNIEHVRSCERVKTYCKKGGDYISNCWEPKMTKAELGKLAVEGKDVGELTTKYPELIFGFCRFKLDVQMYRMGQQVLQALPQLKNLWLWGKSGCGKTTIATTKFGEYYFKDKTKWWDLYTNQPTVVCEDVDRSWNSVAEFFKIWCDHNPFSGECKGGTLRLRPERIIVTSNLTLEEFFTGAGVKDVSPYVRRFREYQVESVQQWEDDL